MRRITTIAVLIAGLGLSALGLAPKAEAKGSLLCPPGCILAGAVSGIGGVPVDKQLNIYGTITSVGNRTSGTANAGGVSTYNIYIQGLDDVDVSPQGVVTGHASVHIDNYGGYDYPGTEEPTDALEPAYGMDDSVTYNVVLAGTTTALELHRSNGGTDVIQIGLVRTPLGGWNGTVVAYDVG